MGKNPVLRRIATPISGYAKWSGEGVAFWWLGQAGFLIRHRNLTIIIDAYLSDALAIKYKGQVYPHRRMMIPPIQMDELTGIDYFISSHSHSDHMDPGLIPVIRDNNPGCRFIMPEAARKTGMERGVPPESLVGVDAGEKVVLTNEADLSFIPSAHEIPVQDAQGHHLFLGVVFDFDSFSIYHPGDCLPYPGLDDWLKPHQISLALMPVNGRNEELSQRGIAGNFNFIQARSIMEAHLMRYMIPHHYGMFDFNTIDRADLDRLIDESGARERIFPAETGTMYHLTEHL